MARLAIGTLMGIVIGLTIGAAIQSHAEPDDETVALAAEAGVNPVDLEGAALSTGLPPLAYLRAVGELPTPQPPPQSPGWPIGGALGQRIFCIEAIESNHGRAMYNPQPWFGEHAQGWLGWLPSTARHWGVTIGNRASEWAGAVRMLQAGAGSQFAGVLWGRC